MGITRKQLKNFGATDYLVKRLTKTLQPVGKQGRYAYEYSTGQVLDSIRNMIDALRLRKSTRVTLAYLEVKVSGFVEDAIKDERLLEAMQRVSEANARFEQTACEARKIATELQDYKRKHGSDFSPRNNIVVFTGGQGN